MKVKNNDSAIKNREPGNPRFRIKFKNAAMNKWGVIKLRPLTSVINLVWNRRVIASNIRKEFVDIRAWLISIHAPEIHRGEFPVIIQIASQCISITVT
jgi:hypothetical protein